MCRELVLQVVDLISLVKRDNHVPNVTQNRALILLVYWISDKFFMQNSATWTIRKYKIAQVVNRKHLPKRPGCQSLDI